MQELAEYFNSSTMLYVEGRRKYRMQNVILFNCIAYYQLISFNYVLRSLTDIKSLLILIENINYLCGICASQHIRRQSPVYINLIHKQSNNYNEHNKQQTQ